MTIKLICLLSALTIPCLAQVSFDKVEIRSTFASATEGNNGHLTIDAKQIVFSKKKNGQQPYFSIPTKAVKDLFYSRVSGRRIGAAILVTPLTPLTCIGVELLAVVPLPSSPWPL